MDKVICVGKNYLKHALELGDAVPTEPVYFLKPPSTVAQVQEQVTWSVPGELHHEVELVLRLSKKDGRWGFSHYTIGLDMTRRDLQAQLKKAGQPWEKAKTFAGSTILGTWQTMPALPEVLQMEFSICVNGRVRQKARGSEMRWQPLELLADLERWFPLCEGDALFTGTPEGVGPLQNGDVVEVAGGLVNYRFEVRRL